MKVLLVHADFCAGGGAEQYAAQIAAVLRINDISVGYLDVHGHCGIDGTRQWPFSLRVAKRLGFFSKILLDYALVCRLVRRFAPQYNRVVFTFGEGPRAAVSTARVCHAPAIFNPGFSHQQFLTAATKASLKTKVKAFYVQACFWLAQPTLSAGDGVLTLSNSAWTARALARSNWVTSTVVYPPVPRPPPMLAIRRDEHAIVAIGRIVPNKRYDEVISIVAGVRARGVDAHLTIIGRCDGAYGRRFVREHQKLPWLKVLPNASDAQKRRVLARATLGLHGYRYEHFGIAVAEFILAGVVPLVFDGGGVVELARDPRLRFSTLQAAVEKAAHLLGPLRNEHPHILAQLSRTEALNRALYFESELKSALGEFLGHYPPKGHRDAA